MIWESWIRGYAGKTVKITLHSGAEFEGKLRRMLGDEYCTLEYEEHHDLDDPPHIKRVTTTAIWVEQIAAISETVRHSSKTSDRHKRKTVTIPRQVVDRALSKARAEYERVAEQAGQDAGPDTECWAEFEALARYAAK